MGVVNICLKAVKILPEDSTESNRINIYDLLTCDGCELVRSDPVTWIGRTCTTNGVARRFRGLADNLFRSMDVPFSDDAPQEEKTTSATTQHCTCPTDELQQAAGDPWPLELLNVTCTSFSAQTNHRRHLAGVSMWTMCDYLRVKGLRCAENDAKKTQFLLPTHKFAGHFFAKMGAPEVTEEVKDEDTPS